MNLSLWIPFECLLAGIAYYDWRHRLIKNKVVVPAFLIATLYRLICHDLSWTVSIIGLLFAGGVFFLLAWMGQVGGGDFKLMALVGWVVGVVNVWVVIAILTLLMLGVWLIRGNKAIPMAPFIFLAVSIQFLLMVYKGGGWL